jgi:hypothetical protein
MGEMGAMSMQTASDVVGESDLEMSRTKHSRSGRLGRLLVKIRPLWQAGPSFERPRRSVDRELQEYEPMDFF